MRTLSLGTIYELEKHRVCDVKLSELVESRGWKEDLAAMVCLITLRSRHHGDGIAAVVLVEASWARATTHHRVAIHAHRIVVVERLEIVGLRLLSELC